MVSDTASFGKSLGHAECVQVGMDGAHVGEDGLAADAGRRALQAEERDVGRVRHAMRHVPMRLDGLLRWLVRSRAHAGRDVGALRAAAAELDGVPAEG